MMPAGACPHSFSTKLGCGLELSHSENCSVRQYEQPPQASTGADHHPVPGVHVAYRGPCLDDLTHELVVEDAGRSRRRCWPVPG